MSNATEDRGATDTDSAWPALPLEAWRETYDTLHMWMQIVGKVRLALTPLVNHWWNVTLYVTPRGLATGPMPSGDRDLGIVFDFLEHNLVITSSDGRRKELPLIPRSVADFYGEFMESLKLIDADVRIWPTPVEVSDPVPFPQDRGHAAYDREYVGRLWRILALTRHVFEEFRARFIGKCSPVHFFWGSFDLAVTRFSGRRAPERPGADRITREAYSHECISHGFWPGGSSFGNEVAEPIFYSYTAPEPPGLRDQQIRPPGRFDTRLSEFVLPYEAVRQASSPRQMLMDFLQDTYTTGANCAKWNRPDLERPGG